MVGQVTEGGGTESGVVNVCGRTNKSEEKDISKVAKRVFTSLKHRYTLVLLLKSRHKTAVFFSVFSNREVNVRYTG